MSQTRTIEGKSNRGDLQEAIADAVQKAQQASTGVEDDLIRWTLKCLSGERGGIAGFNNITVSIEAVSEG